MADKRLEVALLLLSLFSTASLSRAASNPVGAFSLNEGAGATLTDLSGNGHTGAISTGVAWTTLGKYGSALSFSGSGSQQVSLANSATLNLGTSDFTISAWVKRNALGGSQRHILGKCGTTWALGCKEFYFGADNTLRFGSYSTNDIMGPVVNDTAWHYITVTFIDATNQVKLYVDGVNTTTGTKALEADNATHTVTLGNMRSTYPFSGLIDEVRVYAAALAPAEIQADMNTPVGSAPSDTTAPSAPASLSATAVSISQVNLSWSPSTDNVAVTGYKVFRNGAQIATTAATSLADAPLASGTTFSYTVSAYDAAGNVSGLSNVASATTFVSDTVAPSAPPTLSATAVSISQVNLVWGASTDNFGVAGYRVFRNGAQIATTGVTSLSDTSLPSGTTFSYTVSAFDAAGNVSGLSNVASATTLTSDTVAPSVPGGLSATAVSNSQVNLSWSASTDNVVVIGYRVFRNGAQIALTAATSFSDVSLPSGTTFTYTVSAYDAAGNVSGLSNSASATTLTSDTVAPSVPASLSATAVSVSQVNLSWLASTDNVVVIGYRVFRNGAQIALTAATSFSDISLPSGTTFSYTVSAYDAAGNVSGLSNSASATTLTSDTVAPSVPASLSATAVSVSQVNLSWLASTDNIVVIGYRVFRNGAQIALTAATSFSDVSLPSGTTFSYTVSAYDAAGNVSGLSNVASATTFVSDTTAPLISAVGASGITTTSVVVSWLTDEPATSEVEYGSSQTYSNSSGVNAALVTSHSVTITGLASQTLYNYRVRSKDASNNEGVSANSSFTTLTAGSGLAGPLRQLSGNPNYFTAGASGKAIYLTGSHTWNNLQDWGTNGTLHTLDFTAYVNMLVSHNHNFTFLWYLEQPHFCGFPTTGGTPPEYDIGPHPWLRTGPGLATDGKPKFDLTQYDPAFFARLRARTQQLNSAGIYVGVYLFSAEWPNIYRCANDGFPLSAANNINGVDAGGGNGAYSMTSPNAVTATQDAFVEKMIDTLNDLPNVIWATSEEAPSAAAWWNSHQIQHVRSYEASKPFQHPVGYGTFNVGDGANDADLYNSNADWVAPMSALSPSTSCGAGTPTCKVNINDSDHSAFGLWNNSAQSNRNFIWTNFLRGNSTAFMDPYVVYYPREGRNPCVNPVNGVCSAPDPRWENMRAAMGHTRFYADRIHLASMTPQDGYSSTGFILANTNPNATEMLAYAPNGGQINVNLSGTTRTLSTEWFNAATGERVAGPSVQGGAWRTFLTPFSPDSVDAALYIYDPILGAPDTAPPSVPSSLSATAVSSSQINLSWIASTDNTGVAGYSIRRNGSPVGTAVSASFSDAGLSASTFYSYTVAAFDAAGNNSAFSSPASATTLALQDTQPPTVSISSPSAGSTVSGTVTITAAAADNLGVAGVQFLLDGLNLGAEDSGAPFSASWTTALVANGSHTISAVARDFAGNVATSAPIVLSVNNATAPTGLLMHLKFDETSGTVASDSSGSNNAATLINGPAFVAGKAGMALNLDGANDYGTIGDLDAPPAFSLSLWIKQPAALSDWGSVVMKRNTYGFEVSGSTIYFGVGDGNAWSRKISTSVALNQWQHFVGVYSQNTVTLYKDGVQVGSPQAGTLTNSNVPLLIGSWTGTSEFFAGAIDDVRLYDRALTLAEIQAIASGAP